MASKKPSLVQLPCAKTREFGEAEFSDCLPVSASVCVFAFDTGGLGLLLGAFGRSRLYRCQSVPGPPMPCFVAQSFVLASKYSCLAQTPCAKTAKSCAFCDSLPVFLWHRAWVLLLLKKQGNSTFCKVVKQKGEGFWQPLQPWFVKETAFFSAKAQNCKKLRFLR